MEKSIHSVLIIEDESLISYNLKYILETHNYLVCSIASSGNDALRAYESYKPDAILVDINLKGNMTGIMVCHELKKRDYHPVILYITGYSDTEILDAARATLPKAILEKPVETWTLLKALAS
ncbi:MAG: response regulator [Spirochaetales bacterium]|nr:response regulator [Spirochaetales bacterium]